MKTLIVRRMLVHMNTFIVIKITYLISRNIHIPTVFGTGYNFPLIWLPYDDSGSVKNPFFSQHPRKVFETGQFNVVPTMIGITKDEGLLRSHAFYENSDLFNYFW